MTKKIPRIDWQQLAAAIGSAANIVNTDIGTTLNIAIANTLNAHILDVSPPALLKMDVVTLQLQGETSTVMIPEGTTVETLRETIREKMATVTPIRVNGLFVGVQTILHDGDIILVD